MIIEFHCVPRRIKKAERLSAFTICEYDSNFTTGLFFLLKHILRVISYINYNKRLFSLHKKNVIFQKKKYMTKKTLHEKYKTLKKVNKV